MCYQSYLCKWQSLLWLLQSVWYNPKTVLLTILQKCRCFQYNVTFSFSQTVLIPCTDDSESVSPRFSQGSKDSRRQRGKPKHMYSQEQLSVLLHFFQSQPYPAREEAIQLAKKLGLTKAQVLNWFLNRRRKCRALLNDRQFYARQWLISTKRYFVLNKTH